METVIDGAEATHRRSLTKLFGLALAISLGVGVAFFLPAFGGRAYASTSVDLNKRIDTSPPTKPTPVEAGTCEPYFETTVLTPDILHTFFMDNFDQWANRADGSQVDYGNQLITTKIGQKPSTDSINQAAKTPQKYLSSTQIHFVLDRLYKNVPVIKFRKSGTPMPGSTTANPVDGVCESLMAIPVSQTQWRGFQRVYPVAFREITLDSIYRYMFLDYKSASGSQVLFSMHYYRPDISKDDLRNFKYSTLDNFAVDGSIVWDGSPGSGPPINVSDATWQDVSKLTMTGDQGGTYTKLDWSARHGRTIYWLSDAGATPDPTRADLINAPRCPDPFTDSGLPIATCAEAGGKANCVPFISVEQPINFSHNEAIDAGNLSLLQSWINKLGTAPAKYYTYNNATDCQLLNPQGTNVSLTAVGRATLWFAYSKINDLFTSFFQTGDGNEVIYLGQYAKSSSNTYSGGQGGCAGVIHLGPTTNTSLDNFTIDWQLAKENLACTAPNRFYGVLQVGAVGGTAGEAAFNDQTPGTGPDTTVQPLQDLRIGCDYFDNGLSWLICPFVRGAMNLVGLFDSLINKMLDIETGQIFDDTTDTGAAYHSAWRIFRTFALVLIVVAALIMVIAQAAGAEILDAYTIKKILPRLLIVTIGITLSWELMRFAVTLSNDLGHGIRSIIYAPFAGLEAMKHLKTGTNFALLLLGTGAILTYGIIGLLSLVATAVLASLVAVALLAFREIAIVFLVIIAPLGIACAILPFTQKGWKLWSNTFVGLLMVFIFISAFIAIGRVFSVTAASGGDASQLIAILAYFAPYFMIPYAFRLAGGAVGTIAGLVNDRSRGMFDRLKNFRANNTKERMKRLGEGHLFNPESKLTRFLGGNAVNRVGAHVGATKGPGGWRAGFGQKGRAKMANNAFAKYDQYAGEDSNFKAQVDNEEAMAAHAAGNSYAALANMEWFARKGADGRAMRDASGKLIADDGKIKRAIAASSTIQMTGRSRAAALDAVAASGKIFAAGRTGRLEHKALVQTMAGGNDMLEGALMGASQWRMRTSGGRQDTGRGAVDARASTSQADDAWESLKEANLGTLSQQKPWGVEGMVQDAMVLLQPGARIATTKNPDGTVATSRELEQAERQQIMDILYAAQFNPYTNAYQQQEISKIITPETIRTADGQVVPRAADPALQDALTRAAANYRAKLGGGAVPEGAPGGPQAPPVIVAPPPPSPTTAPPAPPTPPPPGPTGPGGGPGPGPAAPTSGGGTP